MFKRAAFFAAFITVAAVGALSANQAENAPIREASVCRLTPQQIDVLAGGGAVEVAMDSEGTVLAAAPEPADQPAVPHAN